MSLPGPSTLAVTRLPTSSCPVSPSHWLTHRWPDHTYLRPWCWERPTSASHSSPKRSGFITCVMNIIRVLSIHTCSPTPSCNKQASHA
ncbi:hypothetical protein VUR80DRAFT_8346 [Thermomyces stellatus]